MRPRPQRARNPALSHWSLAARQPTEHLPESGGLLPMGPPPAPLLGSTFQLRAEAGKAGKAGSGLWPFPPSASFTPSLSYAFQHQAPHPTQSWGPTGDRERRVPRPQWGQAWGGLRLCTEDMG